MIATDNMYPNTARIFTKVGKQGGREGGRGGVKQKMHFAWKYNRKTMVCPLL